MAQKPNFIAALLLQFDPVTDPMKCGKYCHHFIGWEKSCAYTAGFVDLIIHKGPCM